MSRKARRRRQWTVTSALYYSNDGRLRLVVIELRRSDNYGGEWAIELDGREVFRTHDRVKADAYIAGYDLARENVEELQRELDAAEARAGTQ